MITITIKRLGLVPKLGYLFSHKNALINTPPEEFVKDRPILKENIWRVPDLTYKVPLLSSRNPKRRI